MRKPLIAIVVAAGLFGVGAFAANFTVTPDDVASGTEFVESCATDAIVEWETSDTVGDGGDFYVDGATITFVETAERDCAGAEADIAVFLGDETGWIDGSCTDVSASNVAECTFDENDVEVTPVTEVAVLANGNTVSVG